MIPKIIHYCWFGRGEKPELAKKCIASWKKFCPAFEIREWNEYNCDYLAMPFMADTDLHEIVKMKSIHIPTVITDPALTK